MDGVEAVFTSADVGHLRRLQSFEIEGHDMDLPLHPILADDRVCYVGQTIALVAARDRYLARDAAERIKIDYEPLPVVTDPVAAVEEGATLVHEHLGTNAPMQVALGSSATEMEAAKAQAHTVVRQNYHIQRITAAPMEGRAVLAIYDSDRDHLTFYTSTQVPHIVKEELGRCLDRSKDTIRVIAPDVGGGFGQKGDPFPEEIAMAHMAITLKKPIKWVETRTENMAASQARGYHTVAEAAVAADGTLLGVHVRAIADVGAFFIGTTVVPPYNSLHRTIGPYKAPVVQMEVMAVTTNKPTTSPYRGAGGPEGAFAMERTMDLIAKELGMGPHRGAAHQHAVARRLPLHHAHGLHLRLGQLLPRPAAGFGFGRLRRTARAATQSRSQRTADGCGRIHLHEGYGRFGPHARRQRPSGGRP